MLFRSERDKIKYMNCKYGTLVYSKNHLPYQCEEFDDILNNNTNLGGSEDNRYIVFKKELFVVFNGISKKDCSRQMFLYNIKQKLNASNQTELALIAIKSGLINP